MTLDAFRRLALQLPGSTEREHMRHPDFRVNGKIFATLGYPNEEWGMVKLTPEQQKSFLEEAPDAFHPCKGAWGERGATNVLLEKARQTIAKKALKAAFQNVVAKKQLVLPNV